MSDLSEKIQEAAESSPESPLNGRVALMVALSATFMALCNVKDGNVVQGMQAAQSKAVDDWSFYQAKSTKQHIAENTKELLLLQMETTPGLTPAARTLLSEKAAQYDAGAKKYEKEKEEIAASAREQEQLYDEMNMHDDQFDMADAGLSVGIALAGVAALVKRNWLFMTGTVFAAFGVILGVAGFFKLNLHPDWLAKWLS